MKHLLIALLFAASSAHATYCSHESPQFCPSPAQPATAAPSTSSATAAPSTSSATAAPSTSSATAAPSTSSASTGPTSATAGAAAGAMASGAGTGSASITSQSDGSLSIGLPPGVRAASLPAIRCRSTSQAWGAGWNFVSRSTSDSDVDGVCQSADLAAMLISQCQYRTGLEILHATLAKVYPGVTWQIPAGTVNTSCTKPTPAPTPASPATPAPIVQPTPPAPPAPEKITLKAGALFDTDSADLKPEGMIELARLAQRLEPQQIAVVGHTDSTAAPAYNERLSLLRAQAVRAYLIMRGMDPSLITAEGRGLREPVAENTTTLGRMANRRVEIIASGVVR